MKENNEELSVQEIHAANYAEPGATVITEKNGRNGKEKAVNKLSPASEENVSEKIAVSKKAQKNVEKKLTEEPVESKQKSKKTTIKTNVKKSVAPSIASDEPAPKKKITPLVPGSEPAPKKKERKKKTADSETKKELKEKSTPVEATTIKEEESQKKPVTKKVAAKKKTTPTGVKVTFIIRFHSKVGQTLYMTGNHDIFGNNDTNSALPMQYLSEELWAVSLDLNIDSIPADGIIYNYIVKNEDEEINYDWGSDKKITPALFTTEETLIIDAWNFAGYYENAFYTEPFKQVLLKNNYTPVNITTPKTFTHIFKVKAPLLEKGQTVFIAGNSKELGNWGNEEFILMSREKDEDFFSVKLDLSKTTFPIAYKYGVYDVETKKAVRFEDGNNRVLHDAFVKTKKTIVNDGFAVLPSTIWKRSRCCYSCI